MKVDGVDARVACGEYVVSHVHLFGWVLRISRFTAFQQQQLSV